jgi:hypothetical protein
MTHPDYTKLSLAATATATEEIAREVQSEFGRFSTQQLNWKPDPQRWSVAQCLQHLITSNELMVRDGQPALDSVNRTLWQRVSPFSGMFGRLLIRSQGPRVTRKYSTSPEATPAASGLSNDIVQRFVDQHTELAKWMRALREDDARGAIMTSPFVKLITYSVLDGCRLMASHDQRHVGQARRVTQSVGFPKS